MFPRVLYARIEFTENGLLDLLLVWEATSVCTIIIL
jgi:hypothetical protein